MNLYLYFKCPRLSDYKLPGSCQKQAGKLIVQIRKSGLPVEKQEQLISTMIHDLHQREDQAPAILEQTKKEVEMLQDKWAVLKNLEDFFLFVPLWIGLYQALFIEGFENHNLMGPMPFGFGNLAGAIGAYVVFKLLMDLLARDLQGWRRWVSIIVLFGLFLGMMMLSHLFTAAIEISTSSVIVVCVVVFVLAYGTAVRIFEPQKSEPRIS